MMNGTKNDKNHIFVEEFRQDGEPNERKNRRKFMALLFTITVMIYIGMCLSVCARNHIIFE